jgi:hypothetical protein
MLGDTQCGTARPPEVRACFVHWLPAGGAVGCRPAAQPMTVFAAGHMPMYPVAPEVRIPSDGTHVDGQHPSMLCCLSAHHM